MSAQAGALVLLKYFHPEEARYLTIGGMRTTRFVLNNQVIDASHKASGAWRVLLGEAGISSISISGNGLFTDSNTEQAVRRLAFQQKIANFALYFGNGDCLTGPFLISSYERSGSYNEEELYALTLESAGEIGYNEPAQRN